MSNQFKVGDTVRFTDEAYRRLKVDGCRDRDLLVTELLEGGTMLCFINPATELEMRVHERWLEIATPPDLKAEKALLLARVAEIDKALSEQAQGDGLARLRSIIEETGYFRRWDSFYEYDSENGIIEDDDVKEMLVVSVSDGYTFYFPGPFQVPYTSATKEGNLAGDDGINYLPADLNGWSSIPRERFEKARADYEAIVEQVKEAMKP